MPYKNIKEVLVDATKLPAAIEGKLPEGAPKLSTMLLDAAGKIPAVPDFPMEIPDLPAPPEIPEFPAGPGGLGRKYVSGVTVTPMGANVHQPITAAKPAAVSLKSPTSQLIFE